MSSYTTYNPPSFKSTMHFKFLLNKFLLNCYFFFGLQVAVIAGNLDLANVIQRHKPDDVGKFFILLQCGFFDS